jgi:hypothetical protein
MTMNRYLPHVYVIPEDDANRQLASGFVLHHEVDDRRIQVMPPAGGWGDVLRTFQDEYIPKLKDYSHAHVVLLIDFDGDINARRVTFEESIPVDIKARVFVIGSKDNPEALKGELRISFEKIGGKLAEDCGKGATDYWGHGQLKHNDTDQQRLVGAVKPFLFNAPATSPSLLPIHLPRNERCDAGDRDEQ